MTLLTTLKKKEADWKAKDDEKEKQFTAQLKVADEKIMSLESTIKTIKEEHKVEHKSGGKEEQVNFLLAKLKEEKSNLNKMGVIVFSLEGTIAEKELKLKAAEEENGALKEKQLTGTKTNNEKLLKMENGLKSINNTKAAAEKKNKELLNEIDLINNTKAAAEKKNKEL